MTEGNEEFNLEDVSFRPLTKGLGFHQKEPQKSFNSFKGRPLKENLRDSGLSGQRPAQLSSFYQNPTIKKEFPEIPAEEKLNEVTQDLYVPYHFKLFSFLIDLVLILALLALTFVSFFYFSPLDLKTAISFSTSLSFICAFIILFCLYFITYFTLFDLSGSPGKLCFKLRVVETNKGYLTIRHTFLRSLITLSSFLVAFLPLIMDFHGKLSDSKLVIKNEDTH
ncbi:RDD family protein [Bacteriovoracales bacterium]|nr:RDD family protein [Bacteriovoracales bacterium]